MAKVDWITWKTDPSEIINPNTISNKIADIYQDYNCYMNSTVYEGLNHEIKNHKITLQLLHDCLIHILNLIP